MYQKWIYVPLIQLSDQKKECKLDLCSFFVLILPKRE